MSHPYRDLPDRQFWKKEPGIADPSLLDPVSPPPFRISRRDRVVTAGSCFAQHVARSLTLSGLRHHVTERAHSIIPKKLGEVHNYGMFSARYGNVYTARQLRQLIGRAYGTFTPLADTWSAPNGGGVVDPFRPQIQPGGFVDSAELAADRRQHLNATRRSFEEMDVFIFTLGLTEAWIDRRDGAVFPLAPGVAGGVYDPEQVTFRNFDESEVFEDLTAALRFLRLRRPNLRVILTVSPVPLNATYEDRHVMVASSWSKAVLRLVAEKCTKSLPDCYYFPSYEIITSPHVAATYFAPDRREVTSQGVEHVMSLFLRHVVDANSEDDQPVSAPRHDLHHEAMQSAMELLCDEAAIDNI